MPEDKQDWFGTFGFSHGDHRRNSYVILKDKTYEVARAVMFAAYGMKWSHIYPIDELASQIEKYGLTEIPFGE